MTTYDFTTISEFVGKEIGVSEWIQIDQDQINAFADATGDHQWIHVDAERCAAESPLGKTIVHGYLTLSLLPMLSAEVKTIPDGAKQVLNYGADKIRFLSPVPVDSRVRLRTELIDVTEKSPGRFLLKTKNIIEIEGTDKPAMLAETLSLAFIKARF